MKKRRGGDKKKWAGRKKNATDRRLSIGGKRSWEERKKMCPDVAER